MLFLVVVFALLIIFAILYDILLTVLSQQGAGPVTTFWTRHVRKIYLAIHYRRKSGTMPVNLAPLVLAFTFFVWYIALYGAWILLFGAFEQTIESKSGEEVITLKNIVYFVGTTFSTLGPGDYVPTKLPWTLLTTIGAFLASGVMTLSISYLVPVLGSVANREKVIARLHMLGDDTEEIVELLSTEGAQTSLDTTLDALADDLINTSYQSHVYPVLDFFTSMSEGSALSGSVLNLHDALALIQAKEERPDSGVASVRLNTTLRAIDIYIKNSSSKLSATKVTKKVNQDGFAQRLRATSQSQKGLDEVAVAATLERRSLLLQMMYLEGDLKPDESGVVNR